MKPLEKPFKLNSGTTFCLSKVYPDNKGCFVVYSRKIPAITNTLVRFDADGNELYRFAVPVELYPVYFEFDDLSQKFLMAFQGNDSVNAGNMEKFILCAMDSTGNISWKNEFEHTGFVNQIIKSENNYMVISSFKTCNIDGTIYKINADASLWGAMMINFDQSGKITNKFAIKKTSSFYISDVFKLSATSICLIGRKSSPDQPEGDLFFAIVQPGGKIIFNN